MKQKQNNVLPMKAIECRPLIERLMTISFDFKLTVY